MRKRNLPPLSWNEYMGYLGFSDGAPYMTKVEGHDHNGCEVRCAEVFATKKDAAHLYEDFRRVRIIVEEMETQCKRCPNYESHPTHDRQSREYRHDYDAELVRTPSIPNETKPGSLDELILDDLIERLETAAQAEIVITDDSVSDIRGDIKEAIAHLKRLRECCVPQVYCHWNGTERRYEHDCPRHLREQLAREGVLLPREDTR